MALFKLHTLCATIFRPVWFVEYHNHDMESSMRLWYVWHKVKCHCNTSRNNVFYDFFVYFFSAFRSLFAFWHKPFFLTLCYIFQQKCACTDLVQHF